MDSQPEVLTCRRKKSFRTRGKALKKAGACTWKMRVYQCKICNQWHLTKRKYL